MVISGTLSLRETCRTDAPLSCRRSSISRCRSCNERLTHNPWPDLDPAWDASGRLVWAADEPGAEFETYDPFRPGDLHLYRAGTAGPAGTADAERLTDSYLHMLVREFGGRATGQHVTLDGRDVPAGD